MAKSHPLSGSFMGDDNPYNSMEAVKQAEKARNRKAACSYLWLLSFWVMLTNGGDAYVAMHSKQGATITIFTLTLFIPNLGWTLLPFVGCAAVFLYGLGIYGALHGMELRIPGVWDLSQRIFKTKYVE